MITRHSCISVQCDFCGDEICTDGDATFHLEQKTITAEDLEDYDAVILREKFHLCALCKSENPDPKLKLLALELENRQANI